MNTKRTFEVCVVLLSQAILGYAGADTLEAKPLPPQAEKSIQSLQGAFHGSQKIAGLVTKTLLGGAAVGVLASYVEFRTARKSIGRLPQDLRLASGLEDSLERIKGSMASIKEPTHENRLPYIELHVTRQNLESARAQLQRTITKGLRFANALVNKKKVIGLFMSMGALSATGGALTARWAPKNYSKSRQTLMGFIAGAAVGSAAVAALALPRRLPFSSNMGCLIASAAAVSAWFYSEGKL